MAGRAWNAAAWSRRRCSSGSRRLGQKRCSLRHLCVGHSARLRPTSSPPSLAMTKVRVAVSPSVTPAPKSTCVGDTDSWARLVRQRMGISNGPVGGG